MVLVTVLSFSHFVRVFIERMRRTKERADGFAKARGEMETKALDELDVL